MVDIHLKSAESEYKVSSASKIEGYPSPISLSTPVQLLQSLLPNTKTLPFFCAPPPHLHKQYHPSSSLQNLPYFVMSVIKPYLKTVTTSSKHSTLLTYWLSCTTKFSCIQNISPSQYYMFFEGYHSALFFFVCFIHSVTHRKSLLMSTELH